MDGGLTVIVIFVILSFSEVYSLLDAPPEGEVRTNFPLASLFLPPTEFYLFLLFPRSHNTKVLDVSSF